MIKFCIFDLDGTLLDTLPTIKHHLNTSLVKFGLSPVDDEKTKRYIGDGAYQLLFRAMSEQGVTDKERIMTVLDFYMKEYERAPLYGTEVYPGVPELLCSLRENGITPLVLSNKPDVAAKAVVAHYFGNTFALVRGGLDSVPLKPDPTAPLSMLREMGADPSECAFVGDTAVDILTGKNMSAAISIGVLWGFREKEELVNAGADVTVSTAGEIIGVIGEYNGT